MRRRSIWSSVTTGPIILRFSSYYSRDWTSWSLVSRRGQTERHRDGDETGADAYAGRLAKRFLGVDKYPYRQPARSTRSRPVAGPAPDEQDFQSSALLQ